MPIARFELVEEYGEAVLSGNAALFIGAGISQGAGLPGWDGLLDPIRTSCNVPKHHDYPLTAEYIANELAPGAAERHPHILSVDVNVSPATCSMVGVFELAELFAGVCSS